MMDPGLSALKEQFVQMVEAHQGLINSLSSLYYQQRDDQHDARQDVILQLWKSYPAFRGDAKVSTWIYKVGLNTLLSKLRKESRQPKNESLDGAAVSAISMQSSSDDDVQQLKQLIQCLQGLDKAIIVLHLEGYQNKEISSILSLTATNVSTRMNRVRTILKEQFKSGKYEHR